ncbi:MAG: FAD-dependent oxidoreductase, partial [Alphaproteobacteria bacterium]
MRVIVIGASHAGIGFVDAMRRNGFDGELVLLDALVGQPLERPPLSKAFLFADGSDDGRFALRKHDWFADNDIKLIDDCRVTAIHPDAQKVETASGEHMSYDMLVLATGATPRRLPAADGMGGVFELRHPDDA